MPTDPQQKISHTSHRSHRQWVVAAERCLKDGRPSDAFLQEITSDGYSTADAKYMLKEARRRLNLRAMSILLGSIVILVAGIVVTALSLTSGAGYIWLGAPLAGSIGIFYSVRAFVRE